MEERKDLRCHAGKSSLVQIIRIRPDRRPEHALKLHPPPLHPRAISHEVSEPLGLSGVTFEDFPPGLRVELRENSITNLRQRRLPLIAQYPRHKQPRRLRALGGLEDRHGLVPGHVLLLRRGFGMNEGPEA